MGLLKKYYHHPDVTACAIEFMKTVGADLYIRPKVPFCITPTALRHLVSINEMNEWIVCATATNGSSIFQQPHSPNS